MRGNPAAQVDNIAEEYGPVRVFVTDDMGRAFIRKWREMFPRVGWPTLEDSKELIRAAMEARHQPDEPWRD